MGWGIWHNGGMIHEEKNPVYSGETVNGAEEENEQSVVMGGRAIPAISCDVQRFQAAPGVVGEINHREGAAQALHHLQPAPKLNELPIADLGRMPTRNRPLPGSVVALDGVNGRHGRLYSVILRGTYVVLP